MKIESQEVLKAAYLQNVKLQVGYSISEGQQILSVTYGSKVVVAFKLLVNWFHPSLSFMREVKSHFVVSSIGEDTLCDTPVVK